MTDQRPKGKPAIIQVGEVDAVADGKLHAHHWTIGPCASLCMCHRHPGTGLPSVVEDPEKGLLGLVSYRPQGCDCCEPWTVEELLEVVKDTTHLQKWADEKAEDQA